jgi:type I restriction enzyme R subunit
MTDVRDEVPKLRDRHKRVMDVFLTRSISDIRNMKLASTCWRTSGFGQSSLIDPKIPPIEILDVDFADHVNAGESVKARASRMLHAARHHISIHLHEDPFLFKTLSEKLEQILQDLKDNWTELEKELQRFIDDELRQGREQEIEGLDPKVRAPFFGLLKEAIEKSSGQTLEGDGFRTAVMTTIKIVDHIRAEIGRVGFWRDPPSRQRLENWVFRSLRRSRLIPNDQVQELAIRFVDLAKSRHRFLVA